MRYNKLCVVTFSLIAVLILLSVAFVFMPTVKAEENKEIYYNAVQRPALMALYDSSLSYTRKEVLIDTTMSPKTPNYYDKSSNLKNGCAAVAGGIIVGYYDRTLENIIPGYSSTLIRGNNVIYKQVDSNIQKTMEDLFVRMEVNVGEAGATEDDFKNGLREYVADNGYSVTYKSYGSGSNINYTAIADSLKRNEPVALFVTMSHIITNLEIGDTKVSMTTKEYGANHILIANGIKQVRYYNGNKVIRTDTYLSVSTGLEQFPDGYIWVEDTLAVNDIVGVLIN